MQAITRIENTTGNQSDTKSTAPLDDIQVLENFIDHMVTAENNLSKAAAQAALKNQMVQEEYAKRIAFLSSRLHEAESALAALEASLSRGATAPGGSELLNSKKGEVVYWMTRLRQACSPDQLDFGV